MYNKEKVFLGFLVSVESTRKIFHDLVEGERADLSYLLTYKLSQNHLELFFGAIRSAGKIQLIF